MTVTVHAELHNAPTEAVIDEEVIAEWVQARLNDARNTFIMNVSRGGGGGATYGKHTASAPGEYPATDTGRLVNSVDTQMHGAREGSLTSDVQYAAYLTDGTKYMGPRKMLQDALTEALLARPNSDDLAKAVVLRTTTRYGGK